MVGVSTTGGTALKGRSVKKVKHHCFRASNSPSLAVKLALGGAFSKHLVSKGWKTGVSDGREGEGSGREGGFPFLGGWSPKS